MEKINGGINIVINDMLPKNTMVVSPDVFHLMKEIKTVSDLMGEDQTQYGKGFPHYIDFDEPNRPKA